MLLGAGSCEQEGVSLRPCRSKGLMFRSVLEGRNRCYLVTFDYMYPVEGFVRTWYVLL